MKTAVVTGASSGIGLSICRRLVKRGYRVFGLARDFSKTDFQAENFIPIPCDITDTAALMEQIRRIRAGSEVFLLVNNAGMGFYGPHEELNPQKIHLMTALNLEAPLILTNLLLRDLKKNSGVIINISSAAAKKPSTYACAYAATKAGLSHFTACLFEEVRKTGVKAAAIHPDMTRTDFYKNAAFEAADEDDAALSPEDVADAVEYVLDAGPNVAVGDITLKPQKNKIKRKPRNQ